MKAEIIVSVFLVTVVFGICFALMLWNDVSGAFFAGFSIGAMVFFLTGFCLGGWLMVTLIYQAQKRTFNLE